MGAGIWLVSFWFIWVESFRKFFLKNEGLMSIIPWKQPSPIAVVGSLNLVFSSPISTQPCTYEEFGPTCHAAWTEQIVAPKSKILTCFFFWPSPFGGIWRWWEVFMMGGFSKTKKHVGSKEGKGCLFSPCLFSACLSTCSWTFLGSFLLSSLFWAPPRLGVCLAKSDQNQ